MKAIAIVALLAVGAVAVQEMPAPAERLDQHKWLQQLVGEWKVSAETFMGGPEPMLLESTETVRSLGGLWVIAEGTASFGGTPFNSVMTIGYDPEEGAFVGTWIDTMQTHMWTYRGTLDESKKILTLEAEGPSFTDPSKTALYRDAIEIKGPDKKVLTSSAQQEDGSWMTFMRAEYTRRK